MEAEAETCQSNDKKNEKESSQKPAADENTETAKADQKLSPNQKKLRSRSRTPQKKLEEAKTLQVTLKKMEVELNGKDLVEENEKTEEGSVIGDETLKAVEVNEKNGSEKLEKNNEEPPALDKSETESNKSSSTNSTPKKRTSPRIEAIQKNESNFKKPGDIEPEKDSVEMDPLVITDEPDPELQFDENSDMESGKGSPVIQRCMTRRSQTRNIPTPRTPKNTELDQVAETSPTPSEEEEVQDEVKTQKEAEIKEVLEVPEEVEVQEELEILEETETPEEEETQREVLLTKNNLNETSDSADVDVSTRVQVGSDTTRLEYADRNMSVSEDTSYLDASRERSLSETLRQLSARRPIRPTTDHYRRAILRTTQQRSDVNVPTESRDPIERVMTGVKRKDRSATPEEPKKFRGESPARSSLFSSPFTNIRSRFKSELPSSTPKLLGYRDAESSLHYQEDLQIADRNGGGDEKNSWCTIM